MTDDIDRAVERIKKTLMLVADEDDDDTLRHYIATLPIDQAVENVLHALRMHIDYLEAQDGLLEEAQEKAKKAESSLESARQPLHAEMARLNKRVIEQNDEIIRLRAELEARVPMCAGSDEP